MNAVEKFHSVEIFNIYAENDKIIQIYLIALPTKTGHPGLSQR